MAYNAAYYYSFTNRENNLFTVVIAGKDFVGYLQELTASDRPFVLSSTAQDNQIPYGIKATEAVLEFYTGGIVTIDDFYTEDDTYWQVTLLRGTDPGEVEWNGFLQIDNCQERITDVDHILSMNANDGLGRLENNYFIEADTLFGGGNPLVVNWRVDQLLANILPATGMILDVKAWVNIYANGMQDRDDFNYLTFITQTAFSTSYFIHEDGSTMSYYEVLNNLMVDFRCMFTQADGCWQIIRWGDVRLWGDGLMPGTLYTDLFGTYEQILFPVALNVGRNENVIPIYENQIRQQLRPYQYSKKTFNYEQPATINQANLILPDGATPYNTFTIDDYRYDDYDIATYFPSWVQRGGVTSYLEVVTNTAVTPETEIDRGIVIIGDDDLTGGVQFNPIQVTAGDSFDFSLRWRTQPDTDDLIRFWVRCVLVCANDTNYNLTNLATPVPYIWSGPSVSADLWDTAAGMFIEYTNPDDIDTTEWQEWSLSSFVQTTGMQIPPIPQDGVVLIEVRGTNAGSQEDRQNVYFKDIRITFHQYINGSNQIIGQTHLTQQNEDIKNNLQRTTFFDDSPRNTIKGTLFNDTPTNFDYTDINTGAETLIGNVYFTRTENWHRSDIDEARRLGDLNTNNDVFIQRVVRTIVSGDFFGLTGISLMRLINLTWLPGKNFIFGAATFDYMSCVWNASLYELFDTGEEDDDLDADYTFTYLYDT